MKKRLTAHSITTTGCATRKFVSRYIIFHRTYNQIINNATGIAAVYVFHFDFTY